MRSSRQLFRKIYLLLALTLTVCVIVGSLLTHWLGRAVISRKEPHFSVLLAKIIDHLDTHDASVSFTQVLQWVPENRAATWTLIQNNKVIAPPDGQLPENWNALDLPKGPYEQKFSKANRFSRPDSSIIKMKNHPNTYLYIKRKTDVASSFFQKYMTLLSSVIMLSVLVGVGGALAFLFYGVKRKVRQADEIMEQIKAGNLKARIPIESRDFFALPIERFNTMADEIEGLVEKVRVSEKSRMLWFQDLAHDLRTPVASLKNLVEAVSHVPKRLNENEEREFLGLAHREIEYFERLVEDMLILARLEGPRVAVPSEELDLKHLIEEEIEVSSVNSSIFIEKNFSGDCGLIYGHPVLLRRMFRNALENAIRFAKHRVRVSLWTQSDCVQISLQDDGPGFCAQSLKTFGERSVQRSLNNSSTHLSLGLGSVILKAIASAHKGKVFISNTKTGACVNISFPVSTPVKTYAINI